MIKHVSYNDINVGDKVFMKKFISAKDVASFAEIFEDRESFHVSEEAALNSPFKKKICHGMHIASYISELVGKQLPGFGTIYLSQTINFNKPLFIDSEIIVEVQVLEKMRDNNIRLYTKISDNEGKIILDGEAIVKAHK